MMITIKKTSKANCSIALVKLNFSLWVVSSQLDGKVDQNRTENRL